MKLIGVMRRLNNKGNKGNQDTPYKCQYKIKGIQNNEFNKGFKFPLFVKISKGYEQIGKEKKYSQSCCPVTC